MKYLKPTMIFLFTGSLAGCGALGSKMNQFYMKQDTHYLKSTNGHELIIPNNLNHDHLQDLYPIPAGVTQNQHAPSLTPPELTQANTSIASSAKA